MAMHQLDVFAGSNDQSAARQDFPAGFRHFDGLITPEEEVDLLARVSELPFRDFEFHGYRGRRRVACFGLHYDSGVRQLRKADDIPPFLLGLRSAAAEFAQLESKALQHVLVTEYGAGAGIGWHRDKDVYGLVVGISLLSPCVFRLRRRVGERWERVSLIAEPRSAYLLAGPVRDEWEHSIPAVNALRYSITFRNVRED